MSKKPKATFDDSLLEHTKRLKHGKRGYYSELVANMEMWDLFSHCARKRVKLILQTKRDAFAPATTFLPTPNTESRLLPPGRWTNFAEDPSVKFPNDTFVAKLQFLEVVPPRTIRRHVKIERLRRQFADGDLKKLLRELNVKPWQMLPLDCFSNVAEDIVFNLYSGYPHIELHYFDNTEFDGRTPEEWCNVGYINGVYYPCPGEAYLPKTIESAPPEGSELLDSLYEWTNVAIQGYNPETSFWTLLTLDGTKRSFEAPRIRVMFHAEDPVIFAQRVKYAVELRKKVENNIRYQLFIDCSMQEGLATMPQDYMHKIRTLVLELKMANSLSEDQITSLMDEAEMNYRRTNGEMKFRFDILMNPRVYCFVKPSEPNWSMPLLRNACYPCLMQGFKEMINFNRWYSLYAIHEAVSASQLLIGECLQVEGMCFFTGNYGRLASLQEFESAQAHTTSVVLKYLNITWLENVAHSIRMSFRNCGKGWYNIFEKNWEFYEVSKLCRFMGFVRFRMQYALRSLIESSMAMLVSMCETPCIPTFVCDQDWLWDPSDLHSCPLGAGAPPLFHLSLLMDDGGPYYSTQVEQFDLVIQKLYKEMLLKCHFIKQAQPKILTKLVFEKELHLTSIGLMEPNVCEYRDRLKYAYKKAVIPLKAFCREFQIYLEIYQIDVPALVQAWRDEKHSALETKEEVQKHYDDRISLIWRLPQSIHIGPFHINVDTLKQCLVNKKTEIIRALLEMFAAQERLAIEEVIEAYKKLLKTLTEKPNNIEQVFEIREWMESLPVSLKIQDDTTRRVIVEYDVLDHFFCPLENEDFALLWEAVGWPHQLTMQMEETIENLIEEQDKFWKIHQQDEISIGDKIEHFTGVCAALSKQSDFSKVHEIANDIKKIWKSLKESQEWGMTLNNRQKLFNVPVTPYIELNKLVKEFEPYRNLWITASDFLKWREIWTGNPLINIDSTIIEPMVTDFYKMIIKCIRVFADLPAVLSVAHTTKEEIEVFKPLIPIIIAVRNPGMKERHWQEFQEKAGITLIMDDKTTFQMCLEKGVAEYADLIAEIGEQASKEYAIEEVLDEMLADWSGKNLTVTEYKTTGTYIMKVSDEIVQMLDDHLLMTQQVTFSPFKAPFELRIQEWEEKLKLTQAVIEKWMDVQKEWMYLEPIFSSEDIIKQLPVESKKYNSMVRIWKRIMSNANEVPKIMSICPDSRLLDSLAEAAHLLSVVSKGLNEYMETKRMRFPRFFFLSDDELLEILSQARNPLAVQPHLRKCFEAIAKVTFAEDMLITHMHSVEGELVELRFKLYPRGNVEAWLLLLEDAMKNTIRLEMVDGVLTLLNSRRVEWVLQHPGQVVLAGSQTVWTARVEESIMNNKLTEYYHVMLAELDDLRSLVKGQLTIFHREMLCALIVIEVHARDVTRTLVDEFIKSVNDFEWICQLRYYMVVVDPPAEKPEPFGNPYDAIIQDEDHLDTSVYYQQFNPNHFDVRALNSSFPYGNEYLGNTARLVITPLTDRCYLTLMGAMHLNFGGAPAGPAGTGKTETTKDLAKTLAVQCVVFNCSDQLDYMAMGKFFKGLAASGAWACFDEFNRIDIEVLSVIAQQVVTIQQALIQKLTRFTFEGYEIALKPSCSVFITMNPGYAGRTELPDNLKALFRPVAMMVPNYTLIAEISLFSFGFSNAKPLAVKITTTFKLSSEQMSAQDHYDFGMRAVKTVITVAGNLIRQMGDADERQIVLRSLQDVNVPKFLKDDLIIFNGIISDLFPKVENPPIDYGILEDSIRNTMIKMTYDDLHSYIHKAIQLYETTVVRHGLMIVGPAGAGKTKCYEILRDSLSSVKGKLGPDGTPFTKVHTFVLNPKSITMGQLYGEFDPQTHEWTDGILSNLVRLGISVEDTDKRWYVFDGPVDAVWIENMNTVLDDNKKLCLSSGEIMKLTERQRMIFEVADLAVASPATVSRCGMVYIDAVVVGLKPLLTSWMRSSIPLLAEGLKSSFMPLFEAYLLPSLDFLRNNLRELVGTIDCMLVLKFLELINWRLRPLTTKDERPPPSDQFRKNMPKLLPCWVIWSVIWSVGATCDFDSRKKFSVWVRQRMVELGEKPFFPKDGLVYDYTLHDGGFTNATDDGEPANPTWHNWMYDRPEYVVNPEWSYSDIEVPTLDNVRSAALVNIKLLNENNVLCVGPTGTGKTVTISSLLSKGMHKKFICDFIVFSARTSSNQTQDLIDSKLEKRRRGIYGPPLMKKQVFFIDDLNMPALEAYGAQPPIELLRQWMDFGGWYDRRSVGDFREIIEVNFVCAMGLPGGGRNPVTMRLLRHFHFISFTEMEYDSKVQIFSCIFNSWLVRTENCESLMKPILSASLNVFTMLVKELLPTPAKSHYTFNLRDLSKIFQGILMLDPTTIKQPSDVVRLWFHENCRVYQDRLVNDEDRQWFEDLLRTQISTDFKIDPNECLGTGVLLYGDFLEETDDKKYIQITNMEELNEVLDEYLEEYNGMSIAPMRLVLFTDAIRHLCRISRIIRQPMGNALLLGMGGSGRQSLSRLAAHMADLILFQIEVTKAYGINDWRDDIKSTMMKAGGENRGVVFLFSDAQIKMEAFLEDLNNMLSSGDVPNIYQMEELDKVYLSMRHVVMELGLQATKSNLFSAYKRRVRANLHIIITMSPAGEIFRARLRQFPSLVNCCTIDWFSAWPESALKSVAESYIEDMPDLNFTDQQKQSVILMCQFVHQNIIDNSNLFLNEMNRLNYVTPTSYLEMLGSYSTLFTDKKNSIMTELNALTTGLNKLNQTEVEVIQLQKDLAMLKPLLEKAAEEMRIVIEQIALDTAKTEEAKEKVAVEQSEAEIIAAETEAIATDAQKDLDEALPALQAAKKSLKALNKNDIVEVKSLKKPPAGVLLVVETLCVIFNIAPLKVPGEKYGEKVDDYWKPGSLIFSEPDRFLESLMNFDKESITEAMIKTLVKYINNPNYQPQKILKVSKACMSLCMWVHAMFKYYHVNKAVEPKKIKLTEAKAQLAEVEAGLAATQAKMQELLDGLDRLNKYLQQKTDEKMKMQNEIDECMARMDRAVRLLGGLSDERVRWIKTIAELKESLINVIGDILISSCAVAYITPFTDSYRKRIFEEWSNAMSSFNVPHTKGCTPVTVMGEAVLIRKWQLHGLPRDAMSTENAVLVKHSRRWPLFIDPQGQANKWIRGMGKLEGLLVCKQNDRDLLRSFESALRFGKPLLLENIGEDLDPSLDPILKRQVYRQAGQLVLKLGESVIPFTDGFHLYITTKLSNPRYMPEISVKVQVVNFALVPSGLTEQLLSTVVAQERPDLEELRGALIVSTAQMAAQLADMQAKILFSLSNSVGSPVDDVELIETLEAIKIKSLDITIKVADAEKTQADINRTRSLYIPVANRGQILFFCLAGLSMVDPMYQYSLEWFVKLFIRSMSMTADTGNAEASPNEDISERVETIIVHFTYSLYKNVCRSLFEKHKMHFAFLLCARILLDKGVIDSQEFHVLLNGAVPQRELPNPDPSWISEKIWHDVLSMESLPTMVPFVETFPQFVKTYKIIYDSKDPHRIALPNPLNRQLDAFQKLLVVKCLRYDKLTNAMQDYIVSVFGVKFIEPQTINLVELFAESTATMPLIFVLSPGTDPALSLFKLSEKMKMNKRFYSISLGQGQGSKAEALIRNGVETGNWIFLQNCHLSPSWMQTLELLVEHIQPETSHKDFRLWLTSTPSPAFPVALLQNGTKMTMEPPRGIKANLLKAYGSQVQDFHEFFHSEEEKVSDFKRFLFALCLFHGVLLERRKFGPLGFNIPYEFTDGDLKICISQLHMFLLAYEEIPLKMLTYVAGHINYGGRVTDDWDRRCMMSILGDYYNLNVLKDSYIFDESGAYKQLPSTSTLNEYTKYLRTLPINDDPSIFGLHSNANISYAIAETNACLNTLKSLQPRVVVGGGGMTAEEKTEKAAQAILNLIPKPLDIEVIQKKYPVLYEESLNAVLIQESIRYNVLLRIIITSLSDLLKALKGLVVMSDQLENMSRSLSTNECPAIWSKKAYPSLKPLASWVTDLIDRIAFMQLWADEGIPVVFWISGFYFPQAFLTGALQNFARKHVIAIDTINYAFDVLDQPPTSRMTDGCYVRGLYLEGARWGKNEKSIEDSKPKELYIKMPIIAMKPEVMHRVPLGTYECPVYKTLMRAGMLSTTGHSTNYVMTIELPTSRNHPARWIKRGVALFCSLDF